MLRVVNTETGAAVYVEAVRYYPSRYGAKDSVTLVSAKDIRLRKRITLEEFFRSYSFPQSENNAT